MTKIYVKESWNYLTKRILFPKNDTSILQKIIIPWWIWDTWPLNKIQKGTVYTSDVVTKEKAIPELRKLHHEIHIFVGGKEEGGSCVQYKQNKAQ